MAQLVGVSCALGVGSLSAEKLYKATSSSWSCIAVMPSEYLYRWPNGQYDHRPFRPWKSSASPAKLCLFTIFPKLSFAHPLSCYAIFTSSENQTKVFQIKNSTDFIRKINSSSMCNNKNQINELNKKNNVCLRRGNGYACILCM